ncbi:MAG: DNA topoisomerase IV subunit A, partial [Treponema sp.]|nr:DNA topoisomerase IV subunit A [Treponema sp.]
KDLTGCAVEYLDGMLDKFKKIAPELLKRNTTVAKFSATDVKEVARQDLSLRYDEKGYLGINVSGGSELMKVSPYDRIIYVRKNGMYTITDVPDKLFIDKGMWFCALADKEKLPKVLFTVIFKDPETGYASIKRCRIPSWIMNRDYFLAPDGMEVLHIDTREKFTFTLNYVKKPRVKITEEKFKAQDFEEKGLKTLGVRLSAHEVESIQVDGAQLELGL